MAGVVHWNDLPSDLVAVIGDLLDVPIDHVRFRAVCTQWRSSSFPKWPNHLFNYNKIPCLMLPRHDEKLQGFYHLSNHEAYHLEVPQARHRHCVGSSDGWLVTLENGLILKLLNPITNSEIQLPPISSFPDIQEYDPSRLGQEYTILDRSRALVEGAFYLSQADVRDEYIEKIVLSYTNPTNFIAVAIYGDYLKLVFTKSGDQKWTHIPTSSLIYFVDCIFSDGKIYAVAMDGDFLITTIDTPTQLLATHSPNFDLTTTTHDFGNKFYLVRTDGGELLMVQRLIDSWSGETCFYKTVGFNLYRFDFTQSKWIPIQNLDVGYVIFVGSNTSLCLSSAYCPTFEGNNRIYYSDDRRGSEAEGYVIGGHDFGVFNIIDGSLRSMWYEGCPSCLFIWPRPMWVVLNPC